uniref:Uncharacterized protein n=1 Tax=Gopherus agassizii TaxID=38772 RepID=A0A452GTY4_9SAUR
SLLQSPPNGAIPRAGCILGAALSLPACRRQPGPKQFLSEEKMAARFNTLSLENDHVYSGNGLPTRGPAPDPAWAQWVQDYARCPQPEQRYPGRGCGRIGP